MADDDKKEEKESGGKSNLILVIIVLVVGVGLGFVSAYFMVSGNKDNVAETQKQIEIPDSLKDGTPNYEKVILENIAVNPISKTKRMRVLACSLAFDIKPLIKGSAECEVKKIQILDKVISYLSSRDVSFLKDPKAKKIIKKELLVRINKELKDSKIIKLYFTQYILQ